MDCDETSIVVYQDESPHWTVTISLTCPAVRQPLDEGHYTQFTTQCVQLPLTTSVIIVQMYSVRCLI